MKKTVSVLTVILFALFLASCGSSKNDKNETSDTGDTDTSDTGDTGSADTDTGDSDADTGDTDTDTGDSDADTGDTDTDADIGNTDTDTEPDEPEPAARHAIIGKYTDGWTTHIISNSVWQMNDSTGLFFISQFDNENGFIIAHNGENNAWNAGLWSRMDYTFSDDKLYYCSTIYDAESEEAALSAEPADKDDLTSGCTGFSWSELTEITEESISKDDVKIAAWATGYADYTPGENVDDEWKTPEKALGAAEGTSTDVVCLGSGGSIVLTFDKPITNGEGADFAVFENSFDDRFLELGTVEVSSNGTDFVMFDRYYLGVDPIDAFGGHDARLIFGFAGKFRQGEGTMFDLNDLAGKEEVTRGKVDLEAITHIRINDVIGNGSELDSLGNPIYDPYPTSGSAGFDLDAVAVINQAE